MKLKSYTYTYTCTLSEVPTLQGATAHTWLMHPIPGELGTERLQD